MKTHSENKHQPPLTLQALVLYLLLLCSIAAFLAFSSLPFKTLIRPSPNPSFFLHVPPPLPPLPSPQSQSQSQSRGKRMTSEFVHQMDDKELLRLAKLVGASTETKAEEVARLAFLFLVKGDLPLRELWLRFFNGINPDLYSVYVHSPPSYNLSSSSSPIDSVFRGRNIPSKEVQWGSYTMVEAERRLLASALLDTSNQRFVLLSESCIPLFNFSTIYSYLVNSKKNFVEAYDLPGPVGRGRYNPKMRPLVSLSQWRKGSQWFQISRSLAHQIVSDKKYFEVFKKHCKGLCYGDEHYLPTLVSTKFWRENSNRTLTYVDWSRPGPHPKKFHRPLVTVELLENLRNNRSCEYNGEDGNLCFLFARKFPPNSLVRLLLFAPKVLHIK